MLDQNIQARLAPSLYLHHQRMVSFGLRRHTIITVDPQLRILATPAQRPISTALLVLHMVRWDSQTTDRTCRMELERLITRQMPILRTDLDIRNSIHPINIRQAHLRPPMLRDKLRSRPPGNARQSLASIAESAR
jgi:hypothetical protein